MAREINSRGVKYVGIYIRELPWKLTADVAPLRLSGNDRKRELNRDTPGSARFARAIRAGLFSGRSILPANTNPCRILSISQSINRRLILNNVKLSSSSLK